MIVIITALKVVALAIFLSIVGLLIPDVEDTK